jgi:hypothetical protein
VAFRLHAPQIYIAARSLIGRGGVNVCAWHINMSSPPHAIRNGQAREGAMAQVNETWAQIRLTLIADDRPRASSVLHVLSQLQS